MAVMLVRRSLVASDLIASELDRFEAWISPRINDVWREQYLQEFLVPLLGQVECSRSLHQYGDDCWQCGAKV